MYGWGFEDSQFDEAKQHIRLNCCNSMVRLLVKSQQLYETDPTQNKDCFIDIAADQNVSTVQHVLNLASYCQPAGISIEVLTDQELSDIADSIEYLWSVKQIKNTYNKRGNHFSFITNADYFFDKVQEVFAADYEPSHEDILKVQIRTTGLCECTYVIGDDRYRFFDTGGQRNERKKWPPSMYDAPAVIFVASLVSVYEVLFEDESQNAMYETIRLWNEIVNHKWLRHSKICLILNKNDLFKKWLRESLMDINGSKRSVGECLMNGFSLNGKTFRNERQFFLNSQQLDCYNDEIEMKNLCNDVEKIMNFNYPLLLSGYARQIEGIYDVRLPMDVVDLIMLYCDVKFEVFYRMVNTFIKDRFIQCNEYDKNVDIYVATMTHKDEMEKIMWDIFKSIQRSEADDGIFSV